MQQAIITSLLDTDLYKLTMMQCVWHQLKSVEVEYKFYCRKPIDLRPITKQLTQQIEALKNIRLTPSEAQFLSTLPYFHKDFINYLQSFSLDPDYITITEDKALGIFIKGPWYKTILFEVPLLALVSECYYQHLYPNQTFDLGKQRLQEKINFIKQHSKANDFYFSDFGTRRRFSKKWQQYVLNTLKENVPEHFVGTSNVLFAKTLGLNPIGTMAHEYLQAFQAIASDIQHSQADALNTWLKEYQGQLSIALTDALGVDQFLKEFDRTLAQQYMGVRHDSGSPFHWTDKILSHYQSFQIDTKEKYLVYSDSLTIPKAIEICNYVNKRAKASFGIGTNLMNDVGLEPLDIVIKMTSANGTAVIKYPDSSGKVICVDPNQLAKLKQSLQLKETI